MMVRSSDLAKQEPVALLEKVFALEERRAEAAPALIPTAGGGADG